MRYGRPYRQCVLYRFKRKYLVYRYLWILLIFGIFGPKAGHDRKYAKYEPAFVSFFQIESEWNIGQNASKNNQFYLLL